MPIFNTKQHNTCIAFTNLPNEVIYSILQYLTIPDLLMVLKLLNKRLSQSAQQILLHKLNTEPSSCSLRLRFDQENQWRFIVDFKFSKATTSHNGTPRLLFIPIKPVSVRMYSSKFLRRPMLHKASLVGPSFSHQEERLSSNMIKSPIGFDIKRVGHGVQVQQEVLFKYKVSKAPENVIKTRSGERWVEPFELECSFEFLCQTRNKILQRVFHILHKPMKVEEDDLFTTSSSYSVSETKRLYSFDKSIRTELMPIIGGLNTSTMETSF